MTAFIDTSVLVALLNEGDLFHEWSVAEVEKCKISGPAIVCDLVYCETSVAMRTKDELDKAIAYWGLERIAESDLALFKAGKAYNQYRTINRGPKLGVLPDFLIGAVADDFDAPLITTNPKDFVSYFPNLELIRPSKPTPVSSP